MEATAEAVKARRRRVAEKVVAALAAARRGWWWGWGRTWRLLGGGDGGGAEGEEEVVAGLPQLRDAAVGRAVYRPRLHNTQLRQYKPWKLKATCGGSGSKGNVRFCRIRDLVKINLSQHNNYNLQARVPYACK